MWSHLHNPDHVVSFFSGVISGAITSQYLLEKSRIVFQVQTQRTNMKLYVLCSALLWTEVINTLCVFLSQAKDERNYHIFYEMLAGLPSQQKQAFYLQEAETYYYLNQVKELYLQLTTY